MITIKSSFTFMAKAALCILLLSGCQNRRTDNGEIPYDRRNAQKHIISIDYAARLTARYRSGKNELLKQLRSPDYLDKSFSIPDAELFNRDAIAFLLNQKGAQGMRIYVGQDDRGLIRLVLVAADANGNDITGKRDTVSTATYSATGSIPFALEAGQRCPTLCSTSGPIKK